MDQERPDNWTRLAFPCQPWARIDEELATAATPQARMLAIFDALADLFAKPDFSGCAFLKAAAEATPSSCSRSKSVDRRLQDRLDVVGLAVN